jgi:hypothetical protein
VLVRSTELVLEATALVGTLSITGDDTRITGVAFEAPE